MADDVGMGLGSNIGQAGEFFKDADGYDDEELLEDDEYGEEEDNDEDEDGENDYDLEDYEAEEDSEDPEESGNYEPQEYIDVVKTFAGMQMGLLDEYGNPANQQSNMMVDIAQNYENQLRYQRLENDLMKLAQQDEDFNEVSPTFAQTVIDMPELLQYDNGASILYQIAKATYIQSVLPDIVEEIIAERTKDRAGKQAFQTRKSAGSSGSGANSIMSGIMAEAQRTAKLF